MCRRKRSRFIRPGRTGFCESRSEERRVGKECRSRCDWSSDVCSSDLFPPAHPELKTILYSGNVQEETVAFYPARPDRFLRKPFTPKTLIDLVQSVLED